MTAKLVAPQPVQQSASDQVKKDFKTGLGFGKELVGDGSLGRLGESRDLKSVINQKRRLAQGLTGSEVAGQRQSADLAINASTEQARRRLASAQARSGVRGATAGAQQSQIIGQGITAQQNFRQNLIQNDRNAQLQGLSALESSLNTQTNRQQFDLGQLAKEKFSQTATGLQFAGIGATERGSQAQADATKFAANNSGGGTSFICTALRKLGLMNKEEYTYMLKFMLGSLFSKARFMFWYFSEMKEVVDNLLLDDISASRLKQVSVNNVMALDTIDRELAQDAYIDVCTKIASEHGLSIPPDIKTSNIFKSLFYFPRIFTLKSTWKWVSGFVKTKTYKKLYA